MQITIMHGFEYRAYGYHEYYSHAVVASIVFTRPLSAPAAAKSPLIAKSNSK